MLAVPEETVNRKSAREPDPSYPAFDCRAFLEPTDYEQIYAF
jgi:hypothetical protein